MSYITIEYMDNTEKTINTTTIKVSATNKFLKLKVTDVETHYIPLCNIKYIEINGAYKTITDE